MQFKFSENIKRKQILFTIISGFQILFSIYLEKLTQDFIDVPENVSYKFALIIFAFLCLSYFSYVKKYLETYIGKRGNFEGQAFVYKSVLGKGEEILFQNGTGTTLYNVTEDIYEMLPWYSVGRVKLYIEILEFIVLGIYMICVDMGLGAITLILIGISILLADFLSKYVAIQMDLKQCANSELNQSLIETIKSISTIKQLRKAEYFWEKYNEYMDTRYKKILSKVICSQTFYIVQLVFSQEIIPIVVLFVGVISAMLGKTTIGVAIVMMDLSMRISKSVQAIGDLLPQKHTAEKIKHRVEHVLFEEQYHTKSKKAGEFRTLKVEISSFSHELRENSILEKISLEIRKGDICILKGTSGSGKTTIFELIAKTLSTKMIEGKILYNDIDIDDLAEDDYYKHVLLVEQNTALIAGSLKENIMLGDIFSEEALEEVVHVCGLKSFIINKGINFMIEEDGKNISGGEKQRIGLARFLIRKPEVLLLDEVTSSLDKETRDEVVQNIIKYVQKNDMTLLVTSHNNDFDKYANKAITIKQTNMSAECKNC